GQTAALVHCHRGLRAALRRGQRAPLPRGDGPGQGPLPGLRHAAFRGCARAMAPQLEGRARSALRLSALGDVGVRSVAQRVSSEGVMDENTKFLADYLLAHQLADAVAEEKQVRVCFGHPEAVFHDERSCPACRLLEENPKLPLDSDGD